VANYIGVVLVYAMVRFGVYFVVYYRQALVCVSQVWETRKERR